MWVIIPAAGSGRRMGVSHRPKQYLDLLGRTVIEWAVEPFLRHAGCRSIVIVIARSDVLWSQNPVSQLEGVFVACGGEERVDSVRAGLASLSGARAHDWVLVHDAARPCLRDSDLHQLIAALQDDPVGGLLATPLTDTLKRANDEGYVAETVPRHNLWRALTPQMFRYEVLQRALDNAAEQRTAVTDEAQAVELLGLRPRLVSGSADNLKITTPDDLDQAARVLAARGIR
jgi:2-C-methyl-D-erythritol 4-phosphate cytidylyltransferase